MKSVLTALSKAVLMPLGLTAAASATDADIQKKIHGSRCPGMLVWHYLGFAQQTIVLIISSEEMCKCNN